MYVSIAQDCLFLSACSGHRPTSLRQPRHVRISIFPLLTAAASQDPGHAKTKRSMGASILSSVLSLSSVPYSSYVAEPKSFLHYASAEVKQVWTIAVLLIMARAAAPVRIGISLLLLLGTAAALPRRLWQPQLARLGGLCAVLFFFTLIGAEGVPPVVSDRSLASLPASVAAAAVEGTVPAATFPTSMAQMGVPAYRYVLFHFAFITITKRSLSLAVALAGLTFVALQSASLCLVSTPPEAMARAVGRGMRPLGLLGLPVKELVLTMLLALRFTAMVFEEARNLCLGLASRGIDWSQQGLRGTVTICVGLATHLMSNLMARCDSIAVAMVARGFRGPQQHVLHVLDAVQLADCAERTHGQGAALGRVAADLGLLCSLAVMAWAALMVS